MVTSFWVGNGFYLVIANSFTAKKLRKTYMKKFFQNKFEKDQ